MPSNSLDFNQILNITPSGHVQTMINVIKESSPSQDSGISKSSSTPARIPEMSSIFEGVLDAFKLIGFLPYFKHNSLRAFGDNP